MDSRIIADPGNRDTLARPQLENWRKGWLLIYRPDKSDTIQ